MCTICDEVLANTLPNDRNSAFTPCRIKAWFASPAKSMDIHLCATAEVIRPATTEEVARYEAIIAELPSSQRDTGAIDGAAFGLDGQTIYIS